MLHVDRSHRSRAGAVGVVGVAGAGQLALMLYEAALRLDVPMVVLGGPDDPAVRAVPGALVGDPRSLGDMRDLARRCDVLTFDHELVPSGVLAQLERDGVALRPSASAMSLASDKAAQHRLFSELALPLPPTVLASTPAEAVAAAAELGGPVVVKRAHGGYDGRGVGLFDHPLEVASWAEATRGPFVVQPRLALDAEIAVQVVRAADGEQVTYPVVRTVQEEGMCSVAYVPSGLPPDVDARARAVAGRIAECAGVVGLLAVELFVVDGGVLVNEIAARPHNSGHVTQESSLTSQFDNHLRAVCGLPLGAPDLIVPAAAMANVVGCSHTRPDLQQAPPDVSVHLYGKRPRPGRKLGHVTAVAADPQEAVRRAQQAAVALVGAEVRA